MKPTKEYNMDFIIPKTEESHGYTVSLRPVTATNSETKRECDSVAINFIKPNQNPDESTEIYFTKNEWYELKRKINKQF